MIVEFVRNDENLINQVVRLGTKNSKTLGHFPEGAYIEHARRGFLICAYEEDKLFGYLLFSITHSKNSIRIIQLCISENARNQGIAKQLLDFLKGNFRESFKGIALSCRTDYESASALWESYGFKAMNKVRSRSKKVNWLWKWWYDFGNHDLFSLYQSSSTKIQAVLDANIIIKLRSKEMNEKSGTQFLLEDWLVDVIDYFYCPEIFNEIKRDKDDERARKTRSFLSRFTPAKFDPDKRDIIYKQIKDIIPGKSPNDLSDKKQLSECIASEIPYFITIDQKILDADDEINDLFGVQVLRPTDIILLLDESNNRSDYISSRIAGVNFEYSNLKSKEIDSLVDNILVRDKNERKHELRSIFTQSAGNVKTCKVRVVRDKDDVILGVWICNISPSDVSVPLIRTTKNKLAETLFTQLTYEAIKFAVANNRNLITISDPYLNPQDQEILESMGFTLKNSAWIKITARKVIDSDELFNIQGITQLFDEKNIRSKLTGNDFRISLERKLWPLKFKDVEIPTYIIPIRPHWASELFDHYAADTSVFGADASLVWSRENVYYRNIKPVSEKSPGRILWYCSSTKDRGATRTNSIVGCSYLDETYIGKAKELFTRFRHYGVYEWKNILDLAKDDPDNPVKALKFTDTEVFEKPIPLEKVTSVLEKHGRKKNTFMGPLEITNEIFLDIYKIGAKKS